MQERRKFKRIHLIHYLTIFERDTNKLLGNLVDITPEGILIITEKPVEKGQVFHFRMNLPEDFTEAQELNFDVESVWCEVDINPDLFAVGYHLLNTPEEDIAIIYKLIEEYRD